MTLGAKTCLSAQKKMTSTYTENSLTLICEQLVYVFRSRKTYIHETYTLKIFLIFEERSLFSKDNSNIVLSETILRLPGNFTEMFNNCFSLERNYGQGVSFHFDVSFLDPFHVRIKDELSWNKMLVGWLFWA